MDKLSKIIDMYADDVLRACYHYLGSIKDAEEAFEEVFCIAAARHILKTDRNILPDLLSIARRVCLADTLRDDDEKDFLVSFFGLSSMEADKVIDNPYSLAY